MGRLAHVVRFGFVVGLLSLGSCPGPALCDLSETAALVVAQWPNARAARAARDVYVERGVWYWSHGTTSVDGFGVTMIVLDEPPGVDEAWDHVHVVHQGLSELQPNLLFFDQTGGPREEWPLIGFGFSADYVPCEFPKIGCLTEADWVVHEAGYHSVPFGDGGMRLANDDDLRAAATSESVDPFGCEPVYFEDMVVRPFRVRHGRVWSTHVWLDPEGGQPVISVEDPWERWADAVDRVAIEGEVFFEPDPTQCSCVVEAPPSGC